jgi:hypothetical protein
MADVDRRTLTYVEAWDPAQPFSSNVVHLWKSACGLYFNTWKDYTVHEYACTAGCRSERWKTWT